MDEWMDGRTDGRTDGWMDGLKWASLQRRHDVTCSRQGVNTRFMWSITITIFYCFISTHNYMRH